MTAKVKNTAIAVFEHRQQAENAIAELRKEGFPDEAIGFMARNLIFGHESGAGPAAPQPGDHAEEGLAAGAVTGGLVGTALGLAAVAGLITPIGPVIAGGIFSALLASAAAGVAVGGVAGVLIGLGIPEKEASQYEQELREGRIVVTVQANGRYDQAINILRRFGGLGQGSPLI